MKIGIIGLGLIGGSILKSLYDKGFEIFAVTRNLTTIEEAKPYCVMVGQDYKILSGCDVVFVACPMSKTLDILDKLESILPNETIVADVCSLKSFVMDKVYSFKFIGSHPMAGTENAGFEYSFKELFIGAKWVLTPHSDTCAEDIEKLEYVIKQTGATVVVADAKSHDEAVAKISHMPMLLAQALFDSVKNDELALKLASSGFRDMTRLAMSNVDMACDMVEMNTKNITSAINNLNLSLADLEKDYLEKIKHIRELRLNMYDKNGKNII